MPEISYRAALRTTLREALRQDDRVFLMGEDIGAYGGAYGVTKGLIEEFGEERVKDSPIAESVLVGAGIGAAMAGLRPVVELMTINFSLLASDQIVNVAAKLLYMSAGQITVPLIIRTVSGGGSQLAATHSQSLEGWYAQVPGLKVAVPSTPYDARGMLAAALQEESPVIFVEHSLLYGTKGPVPEEPYTVPLGVADVKREGTDVTIVAYSRMVQVALTAAEELAMDGIQAEVVDLRSLRPLDTDTVVESVMKTNRAVVVEEGWRTGGFGAEIVSTIMTDAFDYLDAPVQRVAGEEIPMPYNRDMEQAAMPSPAKVVQAVRAIA